jgi:hypothetical protein
VCQEDIAQAKKHCVPEDIFEKVPLAFTNTSMEGLKNFIEASFRIWLEDELARNFRKMLTIEQYRSQEMSELYQLCLAGGSVGYIEDLFREMMVRGILKENEPKLLALEFFAPFYLLINITMADTSPNIEEAANLLRLHIERFVTINTTGDKNESD